MLVPVVILTLLGLMLGLMLGYAARVFAVEGNEVAAEIAAMMPGTNCGQCGLAGCGAAADALVAGAAPATVCPGGGAPLAQAIAAKLGLTLDLGGLADQGPKIAEVQEDICIGCARCLKGCPTDAIVGASKQIHGVLHQACTGCGACVTECPTGAIGLRPLPQTLQDWNWASPSFA
ncbi:RnfABCDGE type electron transport complex subunit B [Niveibacterium sp. 24ML]|uniref:RnfABCDGE type electron transport complex subunit B n=1 Tax=Niveibacterium sp. 24ML TaxID=2985512 RepID=UPI0022722685|nr:RnfABCDGE type electron transport complex subunit B [Niveibacterium sp. 24ML]MCX9154646.1 RnfABCDGE type electron transport complex subunit B [Niveibacterium sp. 24ML]